MKISEIAEIKIPESLSVDAYTHYLECAQQLIDWGSLYKSDLVKLEAMCEAWGRYKQLSRIIAKEGFIVTDKNGDSRTHPAVREQRMQWEQYMSTAKRYGLTPLDREALKEKNPDIDRAERSKVPIRQPKNKVPIR